MPQGLADAAESFTVAGDDQLLELFLHLLGDGVDVVADQADRALGQDRKALGQGKKLVGFVQQFLQLLIAAVNDVLLLKVRGEVHGEGGHARDPLHEVAPRPPTVDAAADGAVGDVNHVADRPPDHPLGSGVGATTLAHDAGDDLAVRFDRAASRGRFVGAEMGRPFVPGLLRHLGKGFRDQFFGAFLGNARNGRSLVSIVALVHIGSLMGRCFMIP